MYNFLKESHNGIGMLLLFILLLCIIYIAVVAIRKKPISKSTRIVALIGLIVTHLQILIGLLLYVLSPLGVSAFSSEAIGHPIARFYLIEHPVGMLLAAILITIGYRMTKNSKISPKNAYICILTFYTVGFGIISALIPWFLWS